jgi:multiple sugar transport system ATP-binding protein
VAEHLGSDTFVHVHGIEGCDPMTVRAAGDATFKHGEEIFLTPGETQLHKFDTAGLRIE